MTIVIGAVAAALLLVIVELRNKGITQSAAQTVAATPATVTSAAASSQPAQMMIGSTSVDQVAESAGVSALGSVPIVGGLLSSVAGSLLAAHTQRMQDATSENQALDQAVPAWDADITQVIQQWNARAITAAQAVAALQQIDGNIYNYFQKLQGKPGIAWTNFSAPAANPCTAACTACCCVYYTSMHPTIVGLKALISGIVIASGWGHRYTQTPAIGGYVPCGVAAISPNKYSNYSRAGYVLNVRAPG